MISRQPTTNIIVFVTLTHMEPFTQDAYKKEYKEDDDFKKVFQ